MRKLSLLFLLIAGLMISLSSCKDDDDDEALERPNLTGPTTNPAVQVGQSTNISVEIEAPGKIATVTATASAGTVTVDAASLVGKTSGTATIAYTATENAGITNITVTVTDQQNPAKSESTVVTVNVTEEPQKPVVEVFSTSEGVGTVTWTKGNIYVLRGFIFVNEGQTLTIEPGTVIKGQPGQAAGASALIVAKGGKIIAKGSATEPILFTALSDDIEDNTDLPITEKGLWGGLVVLGKSFTNAVGGTAAIEGIPSTETRAVYGGGANPTTDDNSGEYSYISIRHGGTVLAPGSEINGFTLGAVGSGTSVHHIEVWGNADDGVEFFGGTVNTKYIAALYCQDDAFDWDQGFRGEHQFWFAYQQPGYNESNRGMELDGAASSNLTATTFSMPRLYNATIIGENTDRSESQAIFLTEGSGGLFYNSIFGNFRKGIVINNTAGAAGNQVLDRLSAQTLKFENNIFFNIGAAGETTTLTLVSNGVTEVETALTNGGNFAGSAGLTPGTSATSAFNPLPSSGSNPFTRSRTAVPTEAFGGSFGYTNAEFIGAFGTENWLTGWSAADAYGIF